MRTIWLGGLICAAAMSSWQGEPRVWAQDKGSIRFLDNYADAIREAKKTGKPIFLEFRCAP